MKRIYLEITNACNLNCSFCHNEKGDRFLSFVDFCKYVDQIKPICNYIYLHVLGEPLLHPNLEQMLNYLDNKDMNLQLVTNGVLLNKYPNLLKHECLRKLSISIHSINEINVANDYFETITSLIENNSNVKVELRFYNSSTLSEKLKSYLENLKRKYSFELTSKINSYKLKENTYLYFENFFKWPQIEDTFVSEIGTCHGAIDMLAITSAGEVTLCCLDPKAINKIGDLHTETLKEIIDSYKYKQIVNDLKNNKLNCNLCQKCTYRLKFNKQSCK